MLELQGPRLQRATVQVPDNIDQMHSSKNSAALLRRGQIGQFIAPGGVVLIGSLGKEIG
jgi:hypothetical protein